MKKIIGVLILAVLLVFAAGCVSNDEPDNGGVTPSVSGDKNLIEEADKIAKSFGSYNGKAIQWRVLSVDEKNEKALLIAKTCLVEKKFHETEPTESLSWETSDLRAWLNDGFYTAAFTEEQKAKILEVLNPADTNTESGAQGGSDTTDKVFILSASEMNRYFADDKDMASTLNGEGMSYWTRTPGDNRQGYVCTYADAGGGLYLTGNWATSTEVAVRPAVWVSLADDE